MSNVGLVLEGGGMRGVYTAGVLDFFLEQNIQFPSCYAVSAGACHACSYLSGQKGRALRTAIDYLEDKRYCSIYSFLTSGDIFGVEMVYDLIPNQYDPYDYDAFDRNGTRFYVVVTNCRTGEPEYILVDKMKSKFSAIRASSSLPLLSRNVIIGDQEYLDGGISDSIPINKAVADGHRKNVVVLTQSREYRKKPGRFPSLVRIRYRRYPALIKQLEQRYLNYNAALDFIAGEEAAGRTLVIRPKKPVTIGRLEKDKHKLMSLYREGYEDAKELHHQLQAFLQEA